ncbi:uncharacterized protein LOC142523231 [Primulina tabacum]|uniref:uncharacterized protein LOC142523231 n=1 Tax=Primulina tabacum TaxID=48773 RepID=UPI003F594120
MQSYIGVLVREKLTYNVDQSWKKGCLNSANNKWQQYKAFLTQKFIFSKRDKTEDLKEPPTGFGITQDDRSSFVISSLSDDFMKVRDEQKKRRKQKIYPHRMSRKGYARFADKIADELCDDDEINRAIMWKKGRVNMKAMS